LYALTPVRRFVLERISGSVARERPEVPLAELDCTDEWRLANDGLGCCSPPQDKGLAMPIDLDAPGQLHSGPWSAGSGKLCQT